MIRVRVIHQVALCFALSPVLLPPYPLFQWYPQSKEILLSLGMKCWNSTFHAQGSRVIIVVAQEGAVKIYVAGAVQALREKETQDETQFTAKIGGGKTSLGHSYFLL